MPDKNQITSVISNRADDEATNTTTSRRKFLQALGLGSTFIGLNGLGGLVFPSSVLADCSPPRPRA